MKLSHRLVPSSSVRVTSSRLRSSTSNESKRGVGNPTETKVFDRKPSRPQRGSICGVIPRPLRSFRRIPCAPPSLGAQARPSSPKGKCAQPIEPDDDALPSSHRTYLTLSLCTGRSLLQRHPNTDVSQSNQAVPAPQSRLDLQGGDSSHFVEDSL